MTNNNKTRKKLNLERKARAFSADTIGFAILGLAAGGIMDYFVGLNPVGILTTRTFATGVNLASAGIYGWWREKSHKVIKTTKESNWRKKSLAEILAFNTFRTPVYAGLVAGASYVSEGSVDWDKAIKGAIYITAISPLAAPLVGGYMDKWRKGFKTKTASEGVYGKNKNEI
jgi:hypothetical protein